MLLMHRAYFPAYFETIFVGEPFRGGFPDKFAIISACSPTGKKWKEARNQAADQRLRLRTRRWGAHRLTGQSPDGQHTEPGWAVPCSKPTAIKLGKEFQQDAIYWVQDGQLNVLDTSRNRPPQVVGSFHEKFRTDVAVIPTLATRWPSLIVGENKCRQFIKDARIKLTQSEWLLTGEGSESVYHSWKLGYCLLTDPSCGLRALEENELPCGNDGDENYAGVIRTRIVAIVSDSLCDAKTAAAALWRAWEADEDARPLEYIDRSPKIGSDLGECERTKAAPPNLESNQVPATAVAALAALMALPLKARIDAVSADVRTRMDQFASIPPHELANALEVPDSRRPGGDGWALIGYAERRRLEEHAAETDLVADFVFALEDEVPRSRFLELQKLFESWDEGAVTSFAFLSPAEREALEDALARKCLERDLSNGLSTVAHFEVQDGRSNLSFEGDIEDDGSCLYLRTPYDKREGRFKNLERCVTEKW